MPFGFFKNGCCQICQNRYFLTKTETSESRNVYPFLDPSSDPTKETQSFVMEALRMTDLNHPNVMNLLGICWSPNSDNVRYTSPLVVLPYMMLGDLRTHLRGKRIKTTTLSSGVTFSGYTGDTTTSSNEPIVGTNESTTEVVVHWSDKCSLSQFLCRILFRQL